MSPIVLLGLLACASGAPETGARPGECAGVRILVVENTLTQPVEIRFTANRSSAASTFLGMAKPGQSEFTLTPGLSGRPYAELNGDLVANTRGRATGPTAPVRFAYDCRDA